MQAAIDVHTDVHTPKENSLAALPAANPASRISAKADRGGYTSKKRSAPDFCNEFHPESPFLFCNNTMQKYQE